ncbi:DUF6612 family protein [Xylocopilactobacillus apis]|uniref:Lipoprotein n=1 Tax=Xylocopilactobacillus apis TaxID=2932183 RepID=A0AAU9D944_9LACO|nr:DUF6612 family protein [Xylocopilactobacillus apis]BDR57317.1 hypothetical protein KIMC2_18790 [Xylocopilactobacillus apis]
MKSKSIKYYAFAGLAFLSLGLSACSSNSSKGESASEQKKLNLSEVLAKSSSAESKLKSFHVVSKVQLSEGNNKVIDQNSSSYLKKPLNIQVVTDETTNKGAGTSQTAYLDQKNIYQLSGSSWTSNDLKSQKIDSKAMFQRVSNVTDTIFKNSAKDLKLSRQGKDYVVTFKGNVSQIKNQIGDLLAINTLKSPAIFNAALNQDQVKNFTYQATFDHQTLRPEKITYQITLQDANKSQIKYDGKITYSQFNSVDKFIMPH